MSRRQEPDFEVEVRVGDEGSTVVVLGEIDVATAERFERSVLDAAAPGRPVIVDLSGTRFMDSTGLSAIVRIVAHLGEGADDPRMVIDSPSAAVAKTLRISGIDRLVTIRET